MLRAWPRLLQATKPLRACLVACIHHDQARRMQGLDVWLPDRAPQPDSAHAKSPSARLQRNGLNRPSLRALLVGCYRFSLTDDIVYNW
jgi:hypothetical protein